MLFNYVREVALMVLLQDEDGEDEWEDEEEY
jgi:hypothetical protein